MNSSENKKIYSLQDVETETFIRTLHVHFITFY